MSLQRVLVGVPTNPAEVSGSVLPKAGWSAHSAPIMIRDRGRSKPNPRAAGPQGCVTDSRLLCPFTLRSKDRAVVTERGQHDRRSPRHPLSLAEHEIVGHA